MNYKHTGHPRPLIYISNYGDVILKEGDTLRIEGQYVYISSVFNYPDYHRHACYLSNLVDYSIYGICLSEQEQTDILLDRILLGGENTPLEDDILCISQIESNLPQRDLYISHYQFSNQIRPTTHIKYKEGLYYKDEYSYWKPGDFAWYIYRNLYKVLPEGITECDAKLWENIPHMYDSGRYG